MTKIIELQAKVEVRFSWLKYVSGSNLNDHCAKSLIGEYEKRWQRNGQPVADNLELPDAPFYYFCCVTNSYKTNIHVAWVKKEGSTMVVDNDLVHIVVEDAEQIPIDNKSIYWELPQAKNWQFKTCRNWWFANYLKRTFNI